MGCLYSTRQNEGAEEIVLSEVENSLGYHRHSSEYIKEVFVKNSNKNRLSRQNISISLSELSIDFKDFKDFYSYFLTDYGEYNLIKLIVLGIIFGNDGVETKAKSLFELYNRNLKDSINVRDIDLMIRDVIHVTAIVIPQYAAKVHVDKPFMTEYSQNLSNFSNDLIDHFSMLILQDNSSIIKVMFLRKIKNKEIALLLNPKKLREYMIDVKTLMTPRPLSHQATETSEEKNLVRTKTMSEESPTKSFYRTTTVAYDKSLSADLPQSLESTSAILESSTKKAALRRTKTQFNGGNSRKKKRATVSSVARLNSIQE